jgi:hypothetical protein
MDSARIIEFLGNVGPHFTMDADAGLFHARLGPHWHG